MSVPREHKPQVRFMEPSERTSQTVRASQGVLSPLEIPSGTVGDGARRPSNLTKSKEKAALLYNTSATVSTFPSETEAKKCSYTQRASLFHSLLKVFTFLAAAKPHCGSSLCEYSRSSTDKVSQGARHPYEHSLIHCMVGKERGGLSTLLRLLQDASGTYLARTCGDAAVEVSYPTGSSGALWDSWHQLCSGEVNEIYRGIIIMLRRYFHEAESLL